MSVAQPQVSNPPKTAGKNQNSQPAGNAQNNGAQNNAGNGAPNNNPQPQPKPNQITLHASLEEAMNVPNAQPEDDIHYMIEDFKTVPHSKIWAIQEEYYGQTSIESWRNSVPFFITCNTVIADSYADTIVAFLRDYKDKLDMHSPLYIIELASGSGRFAFNTMKALQYKLSFFPELAELPWCYVMTDFTQKNVDFWKENPGYKPFMDAGHLDFALFRAEEENTLHLQLSNKTLSADAFKNPAMILANYYFDTIKQDAFQVRDHKLYEGELRLYRLIKRKDVETPQTIHQLRCLYRYENLIEGDYYSDSPDMNKILDTYRHEVENGTIIFPSAGFRVLENIKTMTGQNYALLSSDKGFTHREFITQSKEVSYAVHGGAFSYMVNYDAMSVYFSQYGGEIYTTKNRNLSLQTLFSTCLRDAEGVAFNGTRYRFDELFVRRNHVNEMLSLYDLSALQDENRSPAEKMEGVMAYLTMYLYDPKILCNFHKTIMAYVPSMAPHQRSELLQIMDQCWKNYYHFSGETNLPFAMAEILFAMGIVDKALLYYQKALELYGPSPYVFHSIGVCCSRLNQAETAMEAFKQALKLDPNFQPSRQELAKMELLKTESESLNELLVV